MASNNVKNNAKIPEPHTDDAAALLLHQAKLMRGKMFKRLEKVRETSLHKARRFARIVLNNPHVVIATLVDVLKKDGIEIGKPHNPSHLEVVNAGLSIDLYGPNGENVSVFPKLRRNGKYGWFHAFGPLETVRNRVATEVAKRLVTLHPRQFIRQGGLPAFERWLPLNISKASVVITTDTPNCFGNMKRSYVKSGLLIPEEVTKKALFETMTRAKTLTPNANGSNVPYDKEPIVAVSSSNRGIPMGAALSALASEVVLMRVLEDVEASAEGVQAASVGDNLIFLLQDATSVQPVLNALTLSVIKYFGIDVIDELTRRNTIRNAEEEFLFCGAKYRWKNGELRKRTEQSRIDNYMIKLDVSLGEANDLEHFETLQNSVRGWTMSQRHSTKAVSEGINAAVRIGEFKEHKSRMKASQEIAMPSQLLETLPMPPF